ILLISKEIRQDNAISIGERLLKDIKDSNLGSLQVNFNQFITSIESYRIHKQSLQVSKKRQHTKQKISKYKSLITDLNRKLKNRSKKLKIEKSILDKNRRMLKKVLTSEVDYLTMRSRYLDMELEIADIKDQKHRYELEIDNLEQLLEEFEIVAKEESEKLWTEIRQYYLSLSNTIHEWNKRYLIHAPIAGQVSFSTRLTQFQYITEGERIISLAPDLKITRGQMG
ncbi:MAG: hypothetical protein ETSY2_54385, partial [Candidatus Entotheonella gemina]